MRLRPMPLGTVPNSIALRLSPGLGLSSFAVRGIHTGLMAWTLE